MFGWDTSKRRAMGKTLTKESMKRVPFQWSRLQKMWNEGKSYLEMAKALDSHYNSDGDDPTKSIRAKCSVAMTTGVKIDGKIVRFKRRSKPHTETYRSRRPRQPSKGKSRRPKPRVKSRRLRLRSWPR